MAPGVLGSLRPVCRMTAGPVAGSGVPRGFGQRGHGRDVQGEQQRHAGGHDQRERELEDRCGGRRDVEQLESGESAEGQGHDQIGHAERVVPQGGATARAPREPVRDQRRGDAGRDIAQARGPGEQRGQMTEGHHYQEGHPFHPERVRVLQAARQARCRQGARDHRNPAQGQQRAEEAGHRNRQPRHPVAEPRMVPAMTRDLRRGGEPAAEHDGRDPGQQRRAPPARQARFAPLYSTTQVAAAIAAVPATVIAHMYAGGSYMTSSMGR